jgi:hypothetical protein
MRRFERRRGRYGQLGRRRARQFLREKNVRGRRRKTVREKRTVADEKDDLFWQQDEGETQEDVLLCDLGKSSGEDAADVVLDSELLDVCV